MITTYFRSSSLGTYDWCENKYYMEYNLGYQDDVNIKTCIGTAVHKVLEGLALCKLAVQQGKNYIDDDVFGRLTFTEEELYRQKELPNTFISAINKFRSNKKVFTWDCKVDYGHVRYGYDFVQKLLRMSFNHYAKTYSQFNWDKNVWYTAENWTWIPLEFNNGSYDPRFRTIFAPEQKFDIEIKKPWSKYEYELDGKTVEGNLYIKGTIDLVTQLSPNCFEMVDWKTGARKNWSTGKVKTYDILYEDTQLLLYNYALKQLFPNTEAMMTIFFIRDGGPFPLTFDDSSQEKMEELLQERFETITKNVTPTMRDPRQKEIQCTWCAFYKNKFDGDRMNMCKRIQQSIDDIGMDKTTKKYKKSDYDVNFYSNPGE